MTTINQITASLVPCAMPTKDGEACGKPGMVGLPAGICGQHALDVHRSIRKLIQAEVGSELSRRKIA